MLRHPLVPMLAGLLVASTAWAGAPLTLTEGWSARWGDPPPLADGRPGWLAPEFEQSLVPTPADREPDGRQGRDTLWISLPIPAAELKAPMLHLALATRGAIEVWSGGERVYASGEIRPGGTPRIITLGTHFIPLPREALGSRVLVRVQREGAVIRLEDLELGEGHEMIAAETRKNIVQLTISGICLLVFLGAFAGWLRFRKQKALPALALFSISIGTVIFCKANIAPILLGQSGLYGAGMALGTFTVVPCLSLFVALGVVQERRRWFQIIIGIVTVACCFTTLGVLIGLSPLDMLQWWFPFGTIGLGATLVVSIIEARRGNAQGRILAFGLATLFSTALVELTASFGLPGLQGVLHFGMLAMLISLIVILLYRFTDLLNRTEQHAGLLLSREGEVNRLGQELSGGAARLAEAVSTLRQAGGIQTEVLLRQNAALTETQTTAAQIGQTSELTSQKASAVLEAAERAERSGRTGGTALAQTLSGLEAVRAEVEDMSERFAGVGERTREIGGVVATVKDIADQSHLLALNARIEAARAGEHGRGFAVVASELGQLAAQSLEATTRIRLELRGVDEAIRSAVQSSAGGSARVEEIVAQTRASAERLREVAGIATETGASAREIAAAVSQQNAGVKQMLEAIRILADGFSTADGAIAESDRAAANVHQVASELLTATRRAV